MVLSVRADETGFVWTTGADEDAADDIVEDDVVEDDDELSFDLFFISEGSIPNMDKKGTDFLCVDKSETGESLRFKFSEDGFFFIFEGSDEDENEDEGGICAGFACAAVVVID